MIKLSFIVPVYNVEQYLRKCVESLIKQDYSDYEIILVDDGSTDESSKICDEFASIDNRWIDDRYTIRVIHQANGGLSAARNAGLKVAKGEYVCFVDSDDFWVENVLGGLMEQVEREELDVLRFKYQNVNEQYEVFNPNKSDPYKYDDYSCEPADGVSFLNSRFGTACYAVMFIIKRSLLVMDEGVNGLMGECLFTPGIYFEDTDWTPRMLCRAKRVASTNTIVYNYLVRRGSITKAEDKTKKKKIIDDKIRLIKSLQQQSIILRKSGRYNRWYKDMISDVVVSLIGLFSVDFYDERVEYLDKLKALDIYPINSRKWKARLINLSPCLAVELLHLKNGHK